MPASCTPVSPAARHLASPARMRSSALTRPPGTLRSMRPMALSTKSPVARPGASRMISPPGGLLVPASIPASSIARSLARPMWPSTLSSHTGFRGDAALIAICVGNSLVPQSDWSHRPPRIHSPYAQRGGLLGHHPGDVLDAAGPAQVEPSRREASEGSEVSMAVDQARGDALPAQVGHDGRRPRELPYLGARSESDDPAVAHRERLDLREGPVHRVDRAVEPDGIRWRFRGGVECGKAAHEEDQEGDGRREGTHGGTIVPEGRSMSAGGGKRGGIGRGSASGRGRNYTCAG